MNHSRREHLWRHVTYLYWADKQMRVKFVQTEKFRNPHLSSGEGYFNEPKPTVAVKYNKIFYLDNLFLPRLYNYWYQ